MHNIWFLSLLLPNEILRSVSTVLFITPCHMV